MAKIRKAAPDPTTENTPPGRAPYVELGITGVTRYGGISRVYEEFLKELQGPAGMKLYREQRDNCPITGAFLFAAQHLARHTLFRVDPADPSQQASAVAERVRGALFDDLSTTWPDLLSEVLSVLPFGWSAHEMVFKRCLGMEPPMVIDAATGWPTDAPTPLLPPGLGQPTAGPMGQGPPAKAERWSPSRYDDGFVGFKKLSIRAQE